MPEHEANSSSAPACNRIPSRDGPLARRAHVSPPPLVLPTKIEGNLEGGVAHLRPADSWIRDRKIPCVLGEFGGMGSLSATPQFTIFPNPCSNTAARLAKLGVLPPRWLGRGVGWLSLFLRCRPQRTIPSFFSIPGRSAVSARLCRCLVNPSTFVRLCLVGRHGCARLGLVVS